MTVAEVFETLDYGPAPESADLAQAWLAERGAKFGLFIGGAWVEPVAATWFATPGRGVPDAARSSSSIAVRVSTYRRTPRI